VISSWHLSTCTGILVPNVWKGKGEIVSLPEGDSPRADRPPVEHLQGIVERVTFHSEESGYTVLRFTVPGVRELVTVIRARVLPYRSGSLETTCALCPKAR
jgi:hypothetical protein